MEMLSAYQYAQMTTGISVREVAKAVKKGKSVLEMAVAQMFPSQQYKPSGDQSVYLMRYGLSIYMPSLYCV